MLPTWRRGAFAGETTLAFYNATNDQKEAVTGISTYNVSPQKAGIYFHKIQCFCFEEQRLLAGETIDMPVFFYIDPDFADDPKVRPLPGVVAVMLLRPKRGDGLMPWRLAVIDG